MHHKQVYSKVIIIVSDNHGCKHVYKFVNISSYAAKAIVRADSSKRNIIIKKIEVYHGAL